jgi:MFS family permease
VSDSSLWRDRRFNLFWTGQTLSTVGDAFTTVAFPLLIYKTTGSIAKMTELTACLAAGAAASALVAGSMVDRLDRRRLLLATDAARAVLMAVIPIASWCGYLSFPLLAVIGAAMGLLGNTFDIAYVAFVAELVSKKRVTEANARLEGTAAASFVVGPALAGLMIEAWGPATSIGVDALSFVASFLSLAAVGGLRTPAQADPAAAGDEGHRRGGLVAGARFIARTPVLKALTLILSAEVLITAAALDLFTYHLKSTLGQSDALVGTMFAVASVGAVVGATLSTLAKRRLGMRVTYVATAFVLALALALVPLAGSFLVTAAIAVAFAFASTVRGVLSMSRRQEVTPDRLLGRVTAAFWLTLSGARMLGAYVVGLVAAAHGDAWTCRGLAAALFVLALLTVAARSLNDPASTSA